MNQARLVSPQERFDRQINPISLSFAEIQQKIGYSRGGVQSALLLSGGFRNSNFRVETAQEIFLLRVNQQEGGEFFKEMAVMKRVRDFVPVPRILEVHSSFALMEFFEGQTLEDALLSGKGSLQTAREVGRALAGIHSLDLGKSGFFDQNWDFTVTFSCFGEGYLNYMQECLQNQIAQNRMGTVRYQKLKEVLREKGELLLNLKPVNRLIHCDFNPKNLFLSEDGVKVLDWEFASSGSPLVDLGNFLRFEEDYSSEFSEAFLKEYQRNVSFSLPHNWREMSLLLDVASMLSFLVKEGDIPRTVGTACQVLDRTLVRIS